ncbi:tetratricopeptide repeat protein [Exilibacterium tricleocarpae]|uniref:Tetratricopeptide repeat protein n=1 Tax=Exilibacterium tricleocarpae TaxID=2591008 RepID=A0A545U9I8_9GAMM|nr:tetratricopeptide repeat protein [Exilibacterium tricleocarpae]TQV86073.1 tetratricopeptide repeat protein [Exilibacterium tricleocarpae]
MERRQLTLMFTDIVGYSRLMGQNEAQTIGLLGEYRRILLAQIERQQGIVIEYVGDAVFARFDTPAAAVQAGIDIQKDLAAFNRRADAGLPRLQSRIGIHMGAVTLKDGALFGDDVNIAARLEPIAVADGLCISASVYRAVSAALTEPVLSLGAQSLKNIDGKIHAYLVRPAGITLATHLHYLLRTLRQRAAAYRYPLAAAVLALVAVGVYFTPRMLVPGYNANYVEIADFRNLMAEEGGADYFSAGVTEALRSQLADIRSVYILAAGKGVRGPIRLEGSVQKIGDRLRIAYQLFRRKGNVQIAGGKLDGAYKDIFILQDRVVAEIAGYLAEEFKLEALRPAARHLTADVTAYDYYLQGLAYLREPESHENFDAAIKQLSTALVHDANFALANTGLCRAYWGKYLLTRTIDWAGKAEEYCQLALRQDNTLSEVYESLGVIYRDTGREEEAVGILEQAIKIDSANPDAVIALAQVYRVQNRPELAEALLQRVVAEHPDYWVAYRNLASFYMYVGRLREAVDTYRKVLQITPENTVAYSNLGVAYFYLGEYESAADALDHSVALSPSSWGYSNTGTMYYFAGDYEKAAAMFREAIRLAPEDFRLYLNMGDTLRQMPRYESEARRYYAKTIDLAQSGLAVNAKDAELHQHLAISYLFMDQREKAEEFLNNALALSPKDVDILYTRVKFWSTLNHLDKALEAFAELMGAGYSQSLVEADPDLEELRGHPRYEEVLLAEQGL